MQKNRWFLLIFMCLFGSQVYSASLPRVSGLVLNGSELAWEAQDGASGYNIYLDYRYFDTVRGALSYTVSEPGEYAVISFNENGEFGVIRNPEEGGQPYVSVVYSGSLDSVKYDYQYRVLLVYNTCKDVGPGGTCIAHCPNQYKHQYGTASFDYLSGGACSTSDIVEADAFIGPTTYSCTVPTFSGEVVAQAVCVLNR